MAERDTGWVQLFAENGQEAVDLTIQAFHIGEDPRVLLPVVVNLDGFILSHMIEPIELPDQASVDQFLPVYQPKLRLDPEHPVSMGAFGSPEVYTEVKKQHEEALKAADKVIKEVWKKFAGQFGRGYAPVETYQTEGAETLLVTMGSISQTAMSAVDVLRGAGKKVGLVRLRQWRPFPLKEFIKAIHSARSLAVVDRSLTPGGVGGPVTLEIRSALFGRADAPYVAGFVAGLGGRDMKVDFFIEMADKAGAYARKNTPMTYEMIGVKEK
jgi:pyruvate ferredoxin oxidoreductase alpha subunit